MVRVKIRSSIYSRTLNNKAVSTGFDLFHLFLLFPVSRDRTKSIDVTEISRDIYEAERAQDKANDDLEAASRNADVTRNQVADVKEEKVRFLLRPTPSDGFLLHLSDH